MSASHSGWIPQSRIRIAVGVAVAFVLAALAGSLWSPFALVLLVVAAGAGWAAFIMMRIRRQLSPGGGGWERRIHAHVASHLGVSSATRTSVLDIGCGDGSLLIALLDHAPGVEATGIDYWGAGWDYAQKACEARLAAAGKRATFRRMDAAHLDFPDASFDAVVSVMCFHEVRAASGATLHGPLRAVVEALRVLRPGGRFVFVDRFADKAAFDQAGLDTALRQAAQLAREDLVSTFGIPWPLKTRRSLGPVQLLSGEKAAQG